MTIQATEKVLDEESYVLDRKLVRMDDRCDSCGSQAFIVASRIIADAEADDGVRVQEFLFCGHHGRRYRAVLEAAGWEIQDFTDLIDSGVSIPR